MVHRSMGHDPDARRAARAMTRERLGQRMAGALPLVWMALLAGATWWLVTRSGPAELQRRTGPFPHQADYTMQRITVQRYDPAGRLTAQIEGDAMRHYPDVDTYEIDNVRLSATLADGHVLEGSAQRSISNGDGSDVQLIGNAHVQRLGAAGDEPIDFRSEFLDVQVNVERMHTHLPVRLTHGATVVEGQAMDYDNLSRTAHLQGRVTATFPADARPTGASALP